MELMQNEKQEFKATGVLENPLVHEAITAVSHISVAPPAVWPGATKRESMMRRLASRHSKQGKVTR